MDEPSHSGIHFWRPDLRSPPCETLEDRFEWSDAIEDVTCEECLQALAGDGGDLGSRDRREDDEAPITLR